MSLSATNRFVISRTGRALRISPFLSKFSLDHNQWFSYPEIIPSPRSFTSAQIAVYDDTLIVFDRKAGYCQVYDLVDERAVTVGVSSVSTLDSLEGIYDSSVAVSSSCIADIRPNYEAIVMADPPLIASFFRRRYGLFAATSLFIKKFNRITTVADLKAHNFASPEQFNSVGL
jgi:hypothetical protein